MNIDTKMLDELNKRRDSFITEIMFCSDATEETVVSSGWSKKGKTAWLAAIVERYRKDLHKICKD